MKTKTLFFSSLVAAAAMSTVPAWATNSTYDSTNKKISWVSADNAYKWVGGSSGAFATATNWVTGTGLNDTPTWSTTNKAPARSNNTGYLLYFDGTSQTISVSGGSGGDTIATSDGGGIWVTGTGNTVTASLGNWAGCIQVDAGNVLNTSWITKLKDGHIVANGTVNVTSGNLNLDGSGERTWFVGADGSITFATATTISTGTISLLGEVDTRSYNSLTNRTASGTETLTKQLVTFSAGITSGLTSLSVSSISDSTTGSALTAATSSTGLTEGQYYAETTSSGVKVYYAAKTYAAETLTWAGTDSSVWVNAGDNWTNSSGAKTSFLNGDNVIFNTAGANVEVSGGVTASTMTVSAATTLSGTGTVSVGATNLTLSAGLTLDDNVTLDLGSSGSAVTKNNISGTGTVKFKSTASGHGGTLTLGSGFTGTIDYTGKFNTSNGVNNPNAKFRISGGSVWGSNTISNEIHFLTDCQIGDTDKTTVVLNGKVTNAAGTTLTVGGTNTTVTFGGETTLGTLRQTAGTLNISGTGTNTITTLTQTAGTANISGTGTTTITTLNISGSNTTLNFSGTGTKTIGSLSTTGNDGTNRTISIAEGTTVSMGTLSNSWGFKTLTINGALNVTGNMTYSSGNMTNTITGSGTLTANTFTATNVGTYVFSGGLSTNITTLTVSRPTTFSNTGTNTIGTLTVGNTLNISGASATVSGTYSGSGTLNVNDGSVLEMVGANGDSGNETNQTAGTVTVKGGGTLKFSGHDLMGWGGTANTAAVLAGTSEEKVARLDINDTASLTLSRSITMNGNALISTSKEGGSSFNSLGGKITATGTNNKISDVGVQIRNDFEIEVTNDSDVLEIASPIKGFTNNNGALGDGGITKSGAGKLILSGDNSGLSTGKAGSARAITISAGTVVAKHAKALGSAATTVESGSVLKVSVNGGVNVGEGSVTFNEGAKFAIDLTAYEGVTADAALSVITASAISFNGGDTNTVTLTSAEIENYFSADDSDLGAWADYARTWNYDSTAGALTLTLTIPEPSTFGLLAGVGALALVAARRRRRAK